MNDLNAKKEELVKQFEGLDSTFSEIKMLMTLYVFLLFLLDF